jgi:N-acetylmuramoyl-L-alanine amidase
LTARTDLLDCRTHAKSWDILRLTKAPAVVVSLGYLSNPGDSGRLANPDFREVLVDSIVIAIQRLYLPHSDDAQTGQLKVADLKRLGLRR